MLCYPVSGLHFKPSQSNYKKRDSDHVYVYYLHIHCTSFSMHITDKLCLVKNKKKRVVKIVSWLFALTTKSGMPLLSCVKSWIPVPHVRYGVLSGSSLRNTMFLNSELADRLINVKSDNQQTKGVSNV